MPVIRCTIEGEPGYKWGDAGKCYPYKQGDDESEKAAKQKALNQGIAIGDIPVESRGFGMKFLSENDSEIIRNLIDPDEFIQDSFEVIRYPVSILMIVGRIKDESLIQSSINPDRKAVQAVKFLKPDWDLENALEWLQENQRDFNDSGSFVKKVYAKELKSIKGVEIFSAGTWNGDTYTTKDLDEMIEAFNETQDSVRPFLKLGHSDKQKLLEAEGLPAAGWIGKVYRKGEKLVADFIDIPQKIYELIENKAYRKVSSEIYLGVKIKDKAYRYMLGAVALLGAETPGVMNLADILSRYHLKSHGTLKTYSNENSDVESKLYSIGDEKLEGELKMEKTQKELELEQKLADAKAALDLANAEVEKFKTDVEAKDADLVALKEAKEEADQKAFEYEKKAWETGIEKQADELVAAKLITKAMRPYAVALLKDEVDAETKKYSFEIGEEKKELDKFEMIKEFATLASQASTVNFDDNSEDSDDGEKGDDTDEVAKYASEHQVTYAEAYRAVYAGKLEVEKPHIEEE